MLGPTTRDQTNYLSTGLSSAIASVVSPCPQDHIKTFKTTFSVASTCVLNHISQLSYPTNYTSSVYIEKAKTVLFKVLLFCNSVALHVLRGQWERRNCTMNLE